MLIIRTPEAMQEQAAGWQKAGRQVVLVPTMGALHEGHAALIRLAAASGDLVVVSLFVNPTQFHQAEDLARYPRPEEEDLALCRREGVAAAFLPTAAAMYPAGGAVTVVPGPVGGVLEGASRPGHFAGVLTVVAKLLHLVRPDTAVFGEKDAQQLHLVRRMVADLNFPVRIVSAPTVREDDGLAMSSRNARLEGDDRARAAALYRALGACRHAFEEGTRAAGALTARVRTELDAVPGLSLDYVDVVDEATFEPVAEIRRAARVVLAAQVGGVRLLDTIRLEG